MPTAQFLLGILGFERPKEVPQFQRTQLGELASQHRSGYLDAGYTTI